MLNTETDNTSFRPSVSFDGRYVTFDSSASNLVAGDTNGVSDIFVYDRISATTIRISVGNQNTEGNDESTNPSISDNGRYVTFQSQASNLVSGDTNGLSDVFVYDLATATIKKISVGNKGAQSNGASTDASISADGRKVSFTSTASNLCVQDVNSGSDIFVYDATINKIHCVSLTPLGFTGNAHSVYSEISPDGTFVTFSSFATNLVSGDTNNTSDIFVYDSVQNLIERISVDDLGAQANAGSFFSDISNNGTLISFSSDASNLVSGDTNNTSDIFVHDRNTGITQKISTGTNGVESNAPSVFNSISSDGRFVAFDSHASNIVSNDTNTSSDVFVYDRIMGTTARISMSNQNTEGNASSANPVISGNGKFVGFESFASNLVPADINNQTDIFIQGLRITQKAPIAVTVK